jgi:hypothetical protein
VQAVQRLLQLTAFPNISSSATLEGALSLQFAETIGEKEKIMNKTNKRIFDKWFIAISLKTHQFLGLD